MEQKEAEEWSKELLTASDIWYDLDYSIRERLRQYGNEMEIGTE
jgi:hypothetical protein